MLNINLFGGPCVGKSAIASKLFDHFKSTHTAVELVGEYAKDLTYGKDYVKLSDQVHVLGEQHHRLYRLIGNVDIAIHDSPFIMGLAYTGDSPIKDAMVELMVQLHNQYNNLNILIVRDPELPYQEYGRNQTKEQAIYKDMEIKDLLLRHDIDHIELTLNDIVEYVSNNIKDKNE